MCFAAPALPCAMAALGTGASAETHALEHGAGHGPGDHIEHPREHLVDQVRGRFHHASCTARRTEAAAFSAEGHQMLMAALATLDPQECLFEPSAAKVRLDYLEISSCLRETALERFQFSHLDR